MLALIMNCINYESLLYHIVIPHMSSLFFGGRGGSCGGDGGAVITCIGGAAHICVGKMFRSLFVSSNTKILFISAFK